SFLTYHPAPPTTSTLSLHDALPIYRAEDAERRRQCDLVLEAVARERRMVVLDVDLDFVLEPVGLQEAEHRRRVEVVLVLGRLARSEEHTSELQSPCNLVCRLLLEKK